jgi:hypothetical protein
MADRRQFRDGRLWAMMIDPLHTAGAPDPHLLARQLVAVVRRERTTTRTFGPGDTVPYDVTAGLDLDGDRWERLGTEPNQRDMWRMPGYDPDQHESSCGGCWLTPHLLERYGPLTEATGRKAHRG